MMNENAQDYLQRAITLMGREEYSEAKKLVEMALSEDPRFAEAYSVLDDIYVNTDELDNALEAYRKVALLEPDNADNLFDMGGVYILKDDLSNGIKCYNNAEIKGYSGYRLFLNLAKIYEGIGHKEQALRNYNKAINANPLNTDLRLAKAVFDVKEGRYQEALEDLDELQQLEPDLFDGYSLRAEIYRY